MAQIKFFRGDRDYFFSAAEGAFNTAVYGDAICFLEDSHELVVNGESYGLSETLKNYINEGNIVTGVEYKDYKLVLTFANGEKSEGIEIPVVDSEGGINGLMLASDKTKLDSLTEALLNSEGNLVYASNSVGGLMSSDDYTLLHTLDGAEGNVATRLSTAESNITALQTAMEAAEGEIISIKGDIGDWSTTAETIATAIGGLDGRVDTLEDQILGLSGAMHFKGVFAEVPKYTGGEGWDYVAGDVIIVGNKEFVCVEKTVEGSENTVFEFVEFGDSNNLATTDQLQAVEKKADDNTSNLSKLAERVSKNESDISSLTTLTGENKSAIQKLGEDIKALEAADEETSKTIDALTKRVSDNETNISSNASALEALSAQVETNKSGIADNVSAISGLSERIKALEDSTVCKDAIDEINETLVSHNTRIEEVENSLTWNIVTSVPEQGE